MFTRAAEMRISKRRLRAKLLQFSQKQKGEGREEEKEDMKCTSSQASSNRYENIDKED